MLARARFLCNCRRITVYLKSMDGANARLVDKPSEPKGTGLYKSGNWAWADDTDDDEDEKITAEANQISAIIEATSEPPVKITRGAFRQLKSKLGSEGSSTPRPKRVADLRGQSNIGSASASASSSKQVTRRSLIVKLPLPKGKDASPQGGRKPSPDIVDLEMSEAPPLGNDAPGAAASVEPDTTELGNAVEDSGSAPISIDSPTQDSTSTPSASNSAPAVPKQSSVVSSSTSPIQEVQSQQVPLTKPKKTWNCIIYEVIAHGTSASKPTMTYPEIVEGVKEHYPYFAGAGQSKTLESSPRNPLYAHDAFYKEERPDKTNAWGIRAGKYIDKKTGKVLVAGPGPAGSAQPSPFVQQPTVTEAPQSVADRNVTGDPFRDGPRASAGTHKVNKLINLHSRGDANQNIQGPFSEISKLFTKVKKGTDQHTLEHRALEKRRLLNGSSNTNTYNDGPSEITRRQFEAAKGPDHPPTTTGIPMYGTENHPSGSDNLEEQLAWEEVRVHSIWALINS